MDILHVGNQQDGIYTIYPNSTEGIQVFCEMAKGGWTRIMNRVDITNAFVKGWSDFKTGFGAINGNHWLGFNSINKILSTNNFMVRFEFENSQLDYFEVDHIKIGSESQNFILTFGQLTKYTILPVFTRINGSIFHTNDYNFNQNCDFLYKAGWWFDGNCHHFCSTCPGSNFYNDDIKWRTYNKTKIFIKRKF